jgi:hypothetical protein
MIVIGFASPAFATLNPIEKLHISVMSVNAICKIVYGEYLRTEETIGQKICVRVQHNERAVSEAFRAFFQYLGNKALALFKIVTASD